MIRKMSFIIFIVFLLSLLSGCIDVMNYVELSEEEQKQVLDSGVDEVLAGSNGWITGYDYYPENKSNRFVYYVNNDYKYVKKGELDEGFKYVAESTRRLLYVADYVSADETVTVYFYTQSKQTVGKYVVKPQ